MSKKEKIKELTKQLLKDNLPDMEKSIEKALNSGAIDTDSWDEDINPMILQKIILISVLEDTAEGFKGKGTSFEKEIKEEVKNLKLFL